MTKNIMTKNTNSLISKSSICIVTSPRTKAAITPLSNFVDIFCSSSKQVYLITGNDGAEVFKINKNIRGTSISHKAQEHVTSRILNHIFLQLKISYEILKLNKNIDSSIFFMGESLLLPVLTLKILRKPIVLSLAASYPKIIDSQKGLQSILKLPKYLEIINYMLADRIVIYSSNLIKEWGLYRYQDKIRISHEHILDFNRFKLEKKYNEREFVIGYIGRFSEEKGIINFVKSIPEILKKEPFLNILIMGDGDLRGNVEKYILENGLENKTKLTGWISHEDLPRHLNSLKLLVMPSYTEGLPNIMLEAMACGTPVLAAKVGAIPDIIKDTQTGFLMEDNSPENIAKNVIRALEYPYIGKIAEDAKSLVESEFTYEVAIEKYSSAFD